MCACDLDVRECALRKEMCALEIVSVFLLLRCVKESHLNSFLLDWNLFLSTWLVSSFGYRQTEEKSDISPMMEEVSEINFLSLSLSLSL